MNSPASADEQFNGMDERPVVCGGEGEPLASETAVNGPGRVGPR